MKNTFEVHATEPHGITGLVYDFEVIDHGWDGSSYFPGCGVFGTQYTDVVTGAGNCLDEAITNALDQMFDHAKPIPHDVVDRLRDMITEPLTTEYLMYVDPACKLDESEWNRWFSVRWRVLAP